MRDERGLDEESAPFKKYFGRSRVGEPGIGGNVTLL